MEGKTVFSAVHVFGGGRYSEKFLGKLDHRSSSDDDPSCLRRLLVECLSLPVPYLGFRKAFFQN